MLTNENIFSVILLTVCVIAWRALETVSYYGAFFPKTLIVILAFLTSVQLIKGILKPTHKKIFEEGKKTNLLIIFVGMLFYIFAMNFIGFLFASIIFMGAMFYLLSDKRTTKMAIQSAVLAVVVGIGFYTLFAKVFMVPLPTGMFF